MELARPYELLELRDGQSVEFGVVKVERGATTIYPAHEPEGKTVDVIRVHVPQSDKSHFPYYYDLTSARLVAQMGEELNRPDLPRLRFKITAQGIPPKLYYRVERRVL